MQTSFQQDEILKRQQHKQNPVQDGHPRFLLSKVDSVTFSQFLQPGQNPSVEDLSFIEGLEDFTEVRKKPMNIFIGNLTEYVYEPKNEYETAYAIESIIPFKNYEAIKADKFLLQLVNDLILMLQEKRFDSADYHFSIANELAPTWAIPSSNLMRMHLLAGNTNKAMDAARVADSLQPGVSFVQMNKGLVMEKEKNLLAAQTYYLQAIQKNEVHFIPYERLGHINIEAGNYEKAENYILHALEYFGKDRLLFANSPATSYVFIENAEDSCLKPMLAQYSYDKLEDYYLLSGVYEKKKLNYGALQLYWQIAQVEKDRLTDQANLMGYKEFVELNMGEAYPFPSDIVIEKYELAPVMGAYLKEAALWEKMGNNQKAEEVILNHQKATQLAGAFRQEAINEKRPGYMGGGSPINFNWLAINREIESVGYHFYRRMLSLFPREPQWYKKASNFLYNRLKMAYVQMEPELYVDITKSIGEYAYPWMGSDEGPEQDDMHIKLPGTGEIIKIEMPVYHPVALSLQWMEKYLSLMQLDKPDLATTQLLADVHSWLGNTYEAVKWWRLFISMQPGNDSLRYEGVRYFTRVNYLMDACAQLDTLHKRNKLNQDQLFQLARYHMLAGKYQPALDVLRSYSPGDTIHIIQTILLKANIYRMMGNTQMALQYLDDSMPVFTLQLPPPTDSMDSRGNMHARDYGNKAIIQTAYARARIYA